MPLLLQEIFPNPETKACTLLPPGSFSPKSLPPAPPTELVSLLGLTSMASYCSEDQDLALCNQTPCLFSGLVTTPREPAEPGPQQTHRSLD